jgi:four helix bundle protein
MHGGRAEQSFHYMSVSRNGPVQDLKDLDAWRVAMDFTIETYRATQNFPSDERFGLRLQLRRAAVSVASNISEGHGRVSRGDYARFTRQARGSLKEAETQIIIAERLGYLGPEAAEALLTTTTRINQLLAGLHRALRRGASENGDGAAE